MISKIVSFFEYIFDLLISFGYLFFKTKNVFFILVSLEGNGFYIIHNRMIVFRQFSYDFSKVFKTGFKAFSTVFVKFVTTPLNFLVKLFNEILGMSLWTSFDLGVICFLVSDLYDLRCLWRSNQDQHQSLILSFSLSFFYLMFSS